MPKSQAIELAKHTFKAMRGAASSAVRKLPARQAGLVRTSASQIDRANMLAVYQAKPLAYKAAKRAFDIVASGTALVVLSPLLVGVGVLIVAGDGMPALYLSKRPGKDLVPFNMCKFRTMGKNADAEFTELIAANELTGAAFKIKDDPRITKIGAFLRKYSIDELPQLVNVLRGEMSIVGPRAIVPVRDFTPYEAQRHVVKPGLTCYWQISGRADVSWDEWVELDLDYIRDMSVSTDLKIIAKTFGAVVRGVGSY